MSSEALSERRLDSVKQVLVDLVDSTVIPGFVMLVSQGGRVHVDAGGARGLNLDEPMRRDTIFRVLSMTKPIAAAAAMTLVDEGKIELDEPVDRLLPELAQPQVLVRLDAPLDETVPANRPITVRDLLTMRMGFGLIMEPSASYPIQRAVNAHQLLNGTPMSPTPHDPDEWMRRLGSLPLMHQPGERWMYHIASDVLGVLIARAADAPLEEVLSKRIFEPLGMVDTAFCVPAAKRDRLAGTCRFDSQSGGIVPDQNADNDRWSRTPAFPSAGGGLVSTVDDFLAFGKMMLDGGVYNGTRVLSESSIREMVTDQISAEQKAVSAFFPGFWDSTGWGLGMSVSTGPDEVSARPGRFGWAGGYDTSWSTDPNESLVAILMVQRMSRDGAPDIHGAFWGALYKALGEKPAS